jgi:hypothetical protein
MDGDLIPTGPLEAAVHNRRGVNLAMFGFVNVKQNDKNKSTHHVFLLKSGDCFLAPC